MIKKRYKGLSPVGSILDEDMHPYTTKFSMEDFDEAVREFEKQHTSSSVFIIFGTKEQIDAFQTEVFWPAMEKAAIAYLELKKD